jgi:hypothetical protein
VEFLQTLATLACESSPNGRRRLTKEQGMFKRTAWAASVVLAMAIAGGAIAGAQRQEPTLAVTMTNDPIANAIKVYDTGSGALVQTVSTQGKGGVSGNARGVKQYQGELVAAVNRGSNTVAVYRRDGARLTFAQLVTTTSAPVSVDFGNGHMYVAGATTVDSFVLTQNRVQWMDGTAALQLADGGTPADGSTAQVGAVNDRRLLVTLKTDPDPGTVDIVALDDAGAIAGTVDAVSAPSGSLTPFGFSVYPDGTALITLAHSHQDGLFRGDSFTAVVAAGQNAPCWTTRVGKYVFTANTGSGTISRLIGTGSNIFIDALVAATVTMGAPSDIDAAGGVMGVLSRAAGASYLSLFAYNRFGELAASGAPIPIGVPAANGVAIVSSVTRIDR